MADLPVVVLAFANEYGADRYLARLAQEQKRLWEVLKQAEALCVPELVINATLDDIDRVFEQHQRRVAIFHYGGHADEDCLLLASSSRSGETDLRGLLGFWGRKGGLHLVFLNGCSTQPQVDDLLRAGVAAVVATARPIDDAVACQFAEGFYRKLTAGFSVRDAFDQAQEIVSPGGRFTPRDMIRKPVEIAPEDITGDRGFPWVLRCRDGSHVEQISLPGLAAALRWYRRRPLYAAAAGGLVAASALVAQAWAWPRPWSSPPAAVVAPPPPPAPLWVERMELEHSRDDGTTDLGTIGVSDTSACRSDDEVRIKARLTAPAYCYLIALHPDGSTQLYHPGDEAVPPPLSDRLSYPPGNDLSPLTDGVGLQAFVLVASREPLPPYAQWKARLGDLSWGAAQAEGVWHYDGQRFEPRSRRRSDPRPAAVAVPTPFAAACRALHRAPGIEAIDAWAFPVLPKESASTDHQPVQAQGGP